MVSVTCNNNALYYIMMKNYVRIVTSHKRDAEDDVVRTVIVPTLARTTYVVEQNQKDGAILVYDDVDDLEIASTHDATVSLVLAEFDKIRSIEDSIDKPRNNQPHAFQDVDVGVDLDLNPTAQASSKPDPLKSTQA